MWNFRVIFAVVCFVFTTKSAKVIDGPYDGTYLVYAKSAGWYGDNECIIKINGGPNLCQNKRGHNVVVIDPLTDEYESVSFDTYGSKKEAKNMVLYLREVKMNNMIIMAIKDSSYPWNWEQSWISEVDSYGSRTLQNTKERWYKYDEKVDGDVGCPFTAYRRPWVLVTQKLPVVNGKRELPAWVTCKYKGHYARVSVEPQVMANIQTHCYDPYRQNWECSKRSLYEPLHKLENLQSYGGCYATAECRQLIMCDERFSVSADTQAWSCQRNGSWSNDNKCPVCKSKLGIEKAFDSEKVAILKGENKTIQFRFETVAKPNEHLMFYVRFNEGLVAEINPYTNKQLIYPYKRTYLKSASDSFECISHKAITNDVHEYTMSYPVINAKLTDNNTKISFLIIDESGGSPLVLHTYVKVLKVKSLNAKVKAENDV